MSINQLESQHQIFEPYNIVTPLEDIPTIIHESIANEAYMNFQSQQHHQHQIDIPLWTNEFSMTTTRDSPFLFCHDSKLVFESLMSNSEGDDSFSSSEKCSEFHYCSHNKPICEHLSQQHKKVLECDDPTDQKSHEVSFQKTQKESCTKQSSPCDLAFATPSNYDFEITEKGKRRLRWTKELHETFIMIVNRLGGPENAKPKAILEMMGLDVLTISHVKSHLQKYRSTFHTHKSLNGISEEGQKSNGINELQIKIQMQIEESRQLQLEVEKSNQRQLEMQQNLQLVIEHQKKQLKLMLDQKMQKTKLKKISNSE